MPAPNLGLVGAYGAAGVQKAIQDMVAERQVAQKLEEERAMAAFNRAMQERRLGLDRQRFDLEGEKFGEEKRQRGVEEDVRRQTLPGEIALRNAQRFKIEVGDPYEQATQREHDLKLAEAGDKDAIARLELAHKFNLEMAAKGNQYTLGQIGARAKEPKGDDSQLLGTIDSALTELKTGKGKEGAVGLKNWTSLWGHLEKPYAGTPEADYAGAADTLMNFLTLTNIDKLAKLSPMSDSDRQFLQSATTRLSRSLQEGTWDAEIARIDRVLTPHLVKAGIRKPTTEEWERGPDGKLRKKGGG